MWLDESSHVLHVTKHSRLEDYYTRYKVLGIPVQGLYSSDGVANMGNSYAVEEREQRWSEDVGLSSLGAATAAPVPVSGVVQHEEEVHYRHRAYRYSQ